MGVKETKMAYGRTQRRYGYVRSGPQAQSPYYQTVQTQQTRDRYGPRRRPRSRAPKG